ncbi:hypothetical protein vseg_015941 [Gypsophila vaccaria]
MNDFGNVRSPRPWNFYPSSDSVDPRPPRGEDQVGQGRGHWKSFGTTSMNAVSFGFVATAILICMFIIMAILERLFRPNVASSEEGVTGSLESRYADKSWNQDMQISTTDAKEITVVMPGHKYPTCIAQPAPLLSCPRHGFRWPSLHPHSSF